MKWRSTVLSLAVLSVLTIPAAQAIPVLYGITFDTHQLVMIDTTTGSSTLVGTVPVAFGSELASFGGNLYVFSQGVPSTFYQIDPVNAAVLSSHTAGVSVFGEGGMSFRADGVAFMTASNGGTGTLFQCDVTIDGGCSTVGALSLAMDGLAFDSGGDLFGIAQFSDALYSINTVTAAVTLIGGPGVGGDTAGGLRFSSDGTLYGVWANQLFTINTASGNATSLGTLGLSDSIGGIAFMDTSGAVPEPATAGMALFGLIAIAVDRFRLRKPL